MVPRPSPDEVHVSWITVGEQAPAAPRLFELLSAEERERARAFHFEPDRVRFIVAHAHLRRVLGRYLGVPPERVPLARDPAGKPLLCGSAAGELGISLSGSRTRAAVAVAATTAVGVDVEDHRPVPDALAIAERYLAPCEAEVLRRADPAKLDATFLRLWTCKEAFVKAIGLGVSYELHRFVVAGLERGLPRYTAVAAEYGPACAWSLRSFEPVPDCYLAVAVNVPDALVRESPRCRGPHRTR